MRAHWIDPTLHRHLMDLPDDGAFITQITKPRHKGMGFSDADLGCRYCAGETKPGYIRQPDGTLEPCRVCN